MTPRPFFLDVDARTFVSSPDTTAPQAEAVLFREDVENVRLHFMRLNEGAYQFLDYSTNTVSVAVGDSAPAALLTSLSAISTSIAVTSAISITGGSGANAVQTVTFTEKPQQGGFALQFPARSVTVSSVSAGFFTAASHGLYNGQSVTLTGFATPSQFANGAQYIVRNRTQDFFQVSNSSTGDVLNAAADSGGTAEIGALTTGIIPAGSTAPQIEATIQAAGFDIDGGAQIIVSGALPEITLTFTGGSGNIAQPLVTVTANTAELYPGLEGLLDLDTLEIASLVAAGVRDVKFEVEVSDGTTRQTYQAPARLLADIIGAGGAPTGLGGNFVLASPDNSVWLISIGDDGALTATKQS